MAEETRIVSLTVNGEARAVEVPVRMLLSDCLRHELGLTGTHVGCEHGVCGSCTIHFDGAAHRSCLLLAVQAHGHEITTIEGLAGDTLHPVQEAFADSHALQCGFCTPGFVMSVVEFLGQNPSPTRAEIVESLASNLCRCTGYQHIVNAVAEAAIRMSGDDAGT